MKEQRLEPHDFENMTKVEVRALADELLSGSVPAILGRLLAGHFSEQFRDQLQLVID